MNSRGFTMIELMVATSILLVISLLGLIVLQSSHASSEVTYSKSEVQGNLRDAMTALTSEVQAAYTERLVEPALAPEGAVSIAVSDDGKEVTFQVPVPVAAHRLYDASTPITYRYETEDTVVPNGILDDAEDANLNGALDRRLVREQDGQSAVVGAANDLSDVVFALLPNEAAGNDDLTRLRITLRSSKSFDKEGERYIEDRLETIIHLAN